MTTTPLKLLFAGTPDFAAVALQALIDAGHSICAVYCQPDRPSGRGKKLQAGPVKKLAQEHNIAIQQPLNFKCSEAVATLAAYQADLMIVVAYGLILPVSVLTTPRLGCLNIHASLLPRWRGAAPIQRAIQSGDHETGITIMQMDHGLDTGDMLLKKSCVIEKNETASSLHDKLAELGGQAICEYLDRVSLPLLEEHNENIQLGEKQDDNLANYAHKLTKQEANIDWQEPAEVIERKIRAFNAWPVCFTFVGNQRLRVWQAQLTNTSSPQPVATVRDVSKAGIEVVCGDQQTLLLTQVQPDGSKPMNVAALLNSRREWFENNQILTSVAS